MTVDQNQVASSLHVGLLGSTTRYIRGKQYVTRAIEAGAGDPLVLLHGVGNSAECFARNVMRLAQHFHVYAIDALYHGFSTLEPYDAEHRVLRQAEAVLDFMNAEGLPWANFEGESMGAGIAFELGMRHPDRCGKLILNSGSYYVRFERSFEPPVDAPPGGVEHLMRLCRTAVTNPGPAAQRARLEYFVARPERITDELVDLYSHLYANPAIHASMERVYGMTAPHGNLAGWTEAEAHSLQPRTLVFWTDKNKGQSPEMGAYLASLLPSASLHVMQDACHWPQWEHPEEHDRVVTAFLQGNS
jgi:pimeloyl-ACP methyl ester carboxylesterase